ncbi:tryptophan-rich sensory protein [Candidatus Collierbacteria bacterium]|nr:tryptophan-rich sensory protein [Candidatus Collierbacteria bacterium]
MNTNWKRLILSLGICQAAGIVGSIYTLQSVKWWYPTLTKPQFNPPAWVFGPVWTILFILMGLSLYLVWNKGLKKKGVIDGIALFGVQLILNITWSYLFFGIRNPFLALVEISVLWGAILLTAWKFYKIDRTAGYLMIPYFLWVGFASYLNLSIVLLN